jgi:4,5-DOPA dioxygenase extradiol
MPAIFVGHGSPMNALANNRYTEAWHEFGAGVARPRAILAISAHWYINATALTAMARPRTIHDFYGFPPELSAIDYPAPGSPDLARQIAQAIGPAVGLDEDSWGIDHGTWSVLVHMFPKADIPVIQLSINALEPVAYHLEIGRRLAPLRRQGVLIMASGNVVHNLRRVVWNDPLAAFDWARRFDQDVKAIMTTNPAAIADIGRHPDFALAAPTPEHFLPLLYLAGLAEAEGTPASVVTEGYAMGSLSMTAYALDYAPRAAATGTGGPATPSSLPPDQTNM